MSDQSATAPFWTRLRERHRAMVAVAALAAIVLVGMAVLLVQLSATSRSEAQRELLDTLGPPSRFVIAYLPRTQDDTAELVRTEVWYYPDHEQQVTFVEGTVATVERMEPDPDGTTYPAAEPWDFDFKTTPAQAEEVLGEIALADEMTVETTAGTSIELAPDEMGAETEIRVYVAHGAALGFQNGALVYIETMGLTDNGTPVDELPEPAPEPGQPAQRYLYPVQRDGKWGYVDANGVVVAHSTYDAAEPMSEGFAPVLRGSGWGYVDAQGVLAIPPQFVFAMPFSEGLAAAAGADERFGFIDTTGAWVIQPGFESAGEFGDGLAPALEEGKWGYIDKSGAWVIEPRFEFAERFSEGLAAVVESSTWGYIDTSGRWAIEPEYASAGEFSGGLAPASLQSLSGYIDETGQFVIEPVFASAQAFSEGLAGAATPEGRVGFINPDGEWVIAARYSDVGPFRGGRAAVYGDFGQIGYIDTAGATVWSVEQ